MSVHQLKDGRWFCQWYENRKTKRKYFGRGEDARQAALDHNISIGLGKRPRVRGAVFGDLVVDYLQAKKGIITDETFRVLCYRFNKNILPFFGSLSAVNITLNKADEYVSKRLVKVKKTTIRSELGSVIAVLNFAVSRGRITHNPLAGYKKPKSDDEIISPPTPDEINSILEHSPDHLQRVIMICAFTGLRPGRKELFNLCQKDVDIDGNTITIRSAKKGGLRYRTIPLHKDFKALLLKWIETDGIDKQRHLITWRDRPITTIHKTWTIAKKKAGIERRLRMYDLRQFWATHL